MIQPSNAPDWMQRYFAWRRDYEALLDKIVERPAVADSEFKSPISETEAAWMWLGIQKAEHLSDLGIFPLTRWRLVASCSSHGRQSLEVETTEEIPDGSYLRCVDCLEAKGATRWLPLVSVYKIGPGE